MTSVSPLQAAKIRADLRQYLKTRCALLSAEFLDVLGDVADLTEAIIRDGFREGGARLPNFVGDLIDRPFVELADRVVEYHTRLVQGPDREIVRKSLLEAYIHAAGPQYAFGPVVKTRLVRSLRQFGVEKFAGLIISLHLFNVISLAIQDELRANMPDTKTFEFHMLGLETMCRDAVNAALSSKTTTANKRWARTLAQDVEAELWHKPVTVGSE